MAEPGAGTMGVEQRRPAAGRSDALKGVKSAGPLPQTIATAPEADKVSLPRSRTHDPGVQYPRSMPGGSSSAPDRIAPLEPPHSQAGIALTLVGAQKKALLRPGMVSFGRSRQGDLLDGLTALCGGIHRPVVASIPLQVHVERPSAASLPGPFLGGMIGAARAIRPPTWLAALVFGGCLGGSSAPSEFLLFRGSRLLYLSKQYISSGSSTFRAPARRRMLGMFIGFMVACRLA